MLLIVMLIRPRDPGKAGSPFWAVMGSVVGPKGLELVGAIGRVWPSGQGLKALCWMCPGQTVCARLPSSVVNMT